MIRLEHTLDITNTYFGTYTFFIRDALPIIADIAFVVASLKKLKMMLKLIIKKISRRSKPKSKPYTFSALSAILPML